jgi:protease IV
MSEKNNIFGKIIIIIIILIGIGIISIITAFILGFFLLFSTDSSTISSGNVAVIKINGVIMTQGSSSIFSDVGISSSSSIVQLIQKAQDDPEIKALLFEINSGGGTPVATDEISRAIEMVNKTKVAWIRDIGASGAYWIASSTDWIVANRMSMVGSIGVRGSYLEFSGLLNRYNVTYEELYAGEYKEYGSPYKKLTDNERKKIMEDINKLHDIFIRKISQNRNLSYEKTKELSTGEVFLGDDAYLFKLIDEIGGKEEALRYIELKLNIKAKEKNFEKEKTFSEILRGFSSDTGYQLGKGMGESLFQKERNSLEFRY